MSKTIQKKLSEIYNLDGNELTGLIQRLIQVIAHLLHLMEVDDQADCFRPSRIIENNLLAQIRNLSALQNEDLLAYQELGWWSHAH